MRGSQAHCQIWACAVHDVRIVTVQYHSGVLLRITGASVGSLSELSMSTAWFAQIYCTFMVFCCWAMRGSVSSLPDLRMRGSWSPLTYSYCTLVVFCCWAMRGSVGSLPDLRMGRAEYTHSYCTFRVFCCWAMRGSVGTSASPPEIHFFKSCYQRVQYG